VIVLDFIVSIIINYWLCCNFRY